MEDHEIIKTHLYVLHQAVAVLIGTHPNPRIVAAGLQAAFQAAENETLFSPDVPDAVRAEAAAFAQELLEIAQEAARDRPT